MLVAQRHADLYDSLKFLSRDGDAGWCHIAHSWFSRLFVPLIRPESRHAFIDWFLLDGVETLYKIGLIIIDEVEEEVMTKCDDAASFLDIVQSQTEKGDFGSKILGRISTIQIVTKDQIKEMHDTTSKRIGVVSQEVSIYYDPKPSDRSDILVRPSQWFHIYSALPLHLKALDPVLLYSGSRHGFLLPTLIRRVKNRRYTIMLVRTSDGEVFGGFAGEEWKQNKEYFGSRNSFVFSIFRKKEDKGPTEMYLIDDSPIVTAPGLTKKKPLGFSGELYKWKRGQPEFFQQLNADGIGFGGAIFLEKNMENGWSRECKTYSSPRLTCTRDFAIVQLEMWGLGEAEKEESTRKK